MFKLEHTLSHTHTSKLRGTYDFSELIRFLMYSNNLNTNEIQTVSFGFDGCASTHLFTSYGIDNSHTNNKREEEENGIRTDDTHVSLQHMCF